MMKTQLLSAAIFLMTTQLLSYSSAEVGVVSAGVRGGLLRYKNEFRADDSNRRLDEDNDESDKYHGGEEEGDQEEESDAQEEDGEGFYETEINSQYVDESDTSTYKSRVEKYESQAAQLFETAPAEWNAGQWDLLFALFGSILVTCCVASALFGYCCIFRDDDPVFIKVKRRKQHKGKDDETVASDDNSKDASLLRSVTSGSHSLSTKIRRFKLPSIDGKESDSKRYSAPIASIDSAISDPGELSVKSESVVESTSGDESEKSTLEEL